MFSVLALVFRSFEKFVADFPEGNGNYTTGAPHFNSPVMQHSKKGCKDHESIQSSTTPDPRYQWESDKLRVRHQ